MEQRGQGREPLPPYRREGLSFQRRHQRLQRGRQLLT
eukprot:COSAG05_NODE_18864_length_301_cov_1.024752_1_plen_36_part_01